MCRRVFVAGGTPVSIHGKFAVGLLAPAAHRFFKEF